MLKDDVIIWVKKCRIKAVSSVDTEAQKYLLKVTEEDGFIKETISKYNQILAIINDMGFVKDFLRLEFPYRYGTKYKTWDLYMEKETLKLGIKIIGAKPEVFPEQIIVLNNLQEKKRRVEREYGLLIEKISKFKTVEKAIKYLQELGFDTSTIKSSINAENLFVCGDNKPEGDCKC